MRTPKVVVFDLDNCCWDPEMYQMSHGSPFTHDPSTNTCRSQHARGETVRLLGDVAEIWGFLRYNGTLREYWTHVLGRGDNLVYGQKEEPGGPPLTHINPKSRGTGTTTMSTGASNTSHHSPFLDVNFRQSGTRIAIASCCDEPDRARELLGKFRIRNVNRSSSPAGGLEQADPSTGTLRMSGLKRQMTEIRGGKRTKTPGTSEGETLIEQQETMRDAVSYVQIHYGAKTQHLSQIQKQSGEDYEDMIFFDDQSGHIRNVGNLGVVAVHTPRGGVTWAHFFQALSAFH
ncbi:unnamed protein product [Amoebophrya sp. A120]|nr:unnamed protein product [Amoebophrya sp. A120]|eukprot:GSA120T00006005001.1